MKQGSLKVHAGMFTVSALFSINSIISKVAMRAIAPLSFACLRIVGGAILLCVIAPPRGFSRADFWRIASFAILGVVLNQTLFLAGLSLTSAHIAAILLTAIPIFTLIVAIVLKLERATARKIGGIVIALAGALLVVGSEGLAGLLDAMTGTLLIVANCIAYATYLVISKPLLERLPALRVVALLFAVAAVVIIPIAAPALLREHWNEIPVSAWISLAAVIVGPTAGAYVINAWTLRHAESSLVALYAYVQPVLTTLLAWLFLGERIRPVVAGAAMLIFAGVAVAGKKDYANR